jgi:hypothetical protein
VLILSAIDLSQAWCAGERRNVRKRFLHGICDNSGHTIISFRLDGEYCTALGECSQKNEDMRIIDG